MHPRSNIEIDPGVTVGLPARAIEWPALAKKPPSALFWFFAAALLFAVISPPAIAKNVDLVTLPKRDTVQLTIYNSEDITLAKERRAVTLRRGKNRLQFSWAGTLIDPTSLTLRPLEHEDKIDVVDTVFPGQKPQHLIWNIESELEGQALVEVSYFTSGLTWQMDYVAISNPDETELSFSGHVRVFNPSGEAYENAGIRLIVGKINLVEKIADLAKKKGIPVPGKYTEEYRRLWKTETAKSFDKAADRFGDEDKPDEEPNAEAKKIVKEGVSEYFMFSVDGTETIPNGWSKRMPAVRADAVEFDIVYRTGEFVLCTLGVSEPRWTVSLFQDQRSCFSFQILR